MCPIRSLRTLVGGGVPGNINRRDTGEMVDLSGADFTNDRANFVSPTDVEVVVLYSRLRFLPRLVIARGYYCDFRSMGFQKLDKMSPHKSSSTGDENAPHSILIATDPSPTVYRTPEVATLAVLFDSSSRSLSIIIPTSSANPTRGSQHRIFWALA